MNRTVYKSIVYSFAAQLVGVLSSICMSAFIPKVISVLNFSYWQLFVFYSSFIGLLHLGWIDGMYLRYGGKDLNQINRKSFSSQLVLYVTYHFLIVAIGLVIVAFVKSSEKIVFYFVLAYIPIKNIYSYFSMTLLSTGNIVRNSKCDILRKSFIIIAISVLLFCHTDFGYKTIIVLYVISELLPFIPMLKSFNGIVYLRQLQSFRNAFKEAVDNINIGWSLTLSNIVSTLVLGVGRFFIKNEWDIITFGKVSLALSMSLFMIMLITQLSQTLFPYIRKSDDEKRKRVFSTLNGLLSIAFYLTFLIYFPIALVVKLWLPQYTDSVYYMSILCGICLFEGKMSMLCTTYLKCLNRQRALLRINIVTVLVSLALAILFSVIFHNLTMIIYSMIIAVAFRCVISILFLQKCMNIENDYKIIIQDLTMVLIFLSFQSLMASWLSFLSITIVLSILFYHRRQDIVSYIKIFKNDNLTQTNERMASNRG